MRLLGAGACLVAAACAAGPSDAEALYRQARAEAGRRPPEEILPLLDHAIALDPTRAAYFLERAELRERLRLPEGAVEDYGRAIGLLRPASHARFELADALTARAVLHAAAGRIAAAEADLGDALRASPRSIEALLERARLFRGAGRAAEADRDLAEARSHGRGAAGAFHDEGVHQLQAGRPGRAERLFLNASDLDPGRLEALVGLARARMESGRFAAAEEALDRALAAGPSDPELPYHRGNSRLAQGKFEEALADFTLAAERDPRNASALAARGLLFHRHRKDPERAEAEFHRALVADPAHFAALFNRGLLYHETGRLVEAERDLRRALAARTDPEAAYALGRVLLDRGDRERAADAFRRTLEICRDPERRKSVEADLARSLRPER